MDLHRCHWRYNLPCRHADDIWERELSLTFYISRYICWAGNSLFSVYVKYVTFIWFLKDSCPELMFGRAVFFFLNIYQEEQLCVHISKNNTVRMLANGLVHHWSWSEYSPLSSHLDLLEYFLQQHFAEWEVPQHSSVQTYALYKLYNISEGESQRFLELLALFF